MGGNKWSNILKPFKYCQKVMGLYFRELMVGETMLKPLLRSRSLHKNLEDFSAFGDRVTGKLPLAP